MSKPKMLAQSCVLQTIVTRYHGATNTRDARVSAKSNNGGKLSLPWNHELSTDDNHRNICAKLAAKLGWPHAMVMGALPGAGYVAVFHPEYDA